MQPQKLKDLMGFDTIGITLVWNIVHSSLNRDDDEAELGNNS